MRDKNMLYFIKVRGEAVFASVDRDLVSEMVVYLNARGIDAISQTSRGVFFESPQAMETLEAYSRVMEKR